MRRILVPDGSESLKYEIREIVQVANKLKKMGLELTHENIGDPAAKGEIIPSWIKEKIKSLLDTDVNWGYCDTQGVYDTRKFIAERTNSEGGAQITADDVYFFNGLGDAVARLFQFLKREARVIGPSPAYSTHSSAEAAHSGYDHLTYSLDPNNGWQPNVEEIYNKAKYNDSIAGILVINPGNPTGSVIKKDKLERICRIAEELDLFVIFDEIYSELVFEKEERVKLSTVIGNTCGISMRGVSKEFPWPGARCAWIEVYNKNRDNKFAEYIETLLKAKRLEVCSTTLPQLSIPVVMGDPRYKTHCLDRTLKYKVRAREALKIFNGVKGLTLVEPKGAFYMTLVFDRELFKPGQYLEISNPEIKAEIDRLCSDKSLKEDKKFCYQLLGATGIITVPLTGFYCDYPGMRLTLLEENDEKRVRVFEIIRDKFVEYIESV